MRVDADTTRLVEDIPYLSLVVCGTTTMVGVICVHTGQWIHMVDYHRVKSLELRRLLIRLCEEWWWRGDRRVPPDVWHGTLFAPFREATVALPAAATRIVAGRTVEPALVSRRRRVRSSGHQARQRDQNQKSVTESM